MTPQAIAATGLACAWLALVWYTIHKTRRARRAPTSGNADIAVIYASQTGTAKDLAQRTADALGAGRTALLAMDQTNPHQLTGFSTVLFIVSTYGEGDPPDMAQAFYRQMLGAAAEAANLRHLEVAVLALGDSSYRHYCGFGHSLSLWLERQGARLLFDTVLADQCDSSALAVWQQHIKLHFQAHIDTDMPYTAWQLAQRRHMNPGSLGGECHELVLQPAGPDTPDWCAGDIAQIQIGSDTVHREYSIASTMKEGALRLLVRKHIDANGNPGIGSHWLTHDIEPGATIQVHIRKNPLFHAPDHPCPAIFIGNGTGIAGLRSLLQARLGQGHYENWLIFGERQRAHDLHYGDELQAWHTQQKLQRLDLAFSRDQVQKRYVHHLLREAAPQVQEWVARGAMIYVCGSQSTMARDVDQALQDILGNKGYAELVKQQHYRRDIY